MGSNYLSVEDAIVKGLSELLESAADFGTAADGRRLFAQIAGAWNEKSGLLNDLVAPVDESGSLTGG